MENRNGMTLAAIIIAAIGALITLFGIFVSIFFYFEGEIDTLEEQVFQMNSRLSELEGRSTTQSTPSENR